jgi:Arabinose efflux permease
MSLVIAHAIFVQVITYALRPTLSYAMLDAGNAAALLGLLAAGFAFPALLFALPAGHWVDRAGERPALVLSSILMIVAAVIATLAGGSFWLLMASTIFLGLGQLLAGVGEQTLIAKIRGSKRADSRFGFYTFAVSLGQTLGPLLLALPGGTQSTPPLQLVFLSCVGLGVLMLALSSIMKSSARVVGAKPVRMLTTARSLMTTPGVPRALVAGAVVLSSIDLFLAYVPALGQDHGLTAVAVGLMLSMRSLFSMISRVFLGTLIRLVGRRRLLVWTISLSAVALGCMAFPLPGGWLLVLSAIYGFNVGTCQPITMAWVSGLAVRESRGLALSLRLAANRLGQTIIPATLGVFAAATGAAGVLVAVAVVLLGAAWSANAITDAERPDDAPIELA